jgi:hypothetical protein
MVSLAHILAAQDPKHVDKIEVVRLNVVAMPKEECLEQFCMDVGGGFLLLYSGCGTIVGLSQNVMT